MRVRLIVLVLNSILAIHLFAFPSMNETRALSQERPPEPEIQFPFHEDWLENDAVLRQVVRKIQRASSSSLSGSSPSGERGALLTFREAIAKSLLQMVGKELSAEDAHQIALPIEKAAAAALGLRPEIESGPKAASFLRAIRIILRKFPPNKDYEVPYVAGYSGDGKTIYIDRTVRTVRYSGFTSDDFLTVHEVMEKALLMGKLGLRYQEAHQCALRLEKATIEISGNNWKNYDDLMRSYIQTTYRLPRSVPHDLDLTPYRDENDTEYVRKMESLQSAPPR